MSAAASALWASIVRTIIPGIVGAILGFAVSSGIEVDPQFAAALTTWLSVGFSGLYYIAVRVLETYVAPKLGWLLGLAKSPVAYTPESPAK